MISAWARMCKILGKEFQQYLPVVMGPLMKTASIKPEVALLDSKFYAGWMLGLILVSTVDSYRTLQGSHSHYRISIIEVKT